MGRRPKKVLELKGIAEQEAMESVLNDPRMAKSVWKRI